VNNVLYNRTAQEVRKPPHLFLLRNFYINFSAIDQRRADRFTYGPEFHYQC
jgi:hypothetical protein